MGKVKEMAAEVGKALRFNEGKLKWSLVHWKSIEPLVRVLMFGAKKYAPNNWQKPMDRQEILESAMRHLTAMMSGETRDPESGLSHAGHVMCNMMFWVFHTDKAENTPKVVEALQDLEELDKECCGDWDEDGVCTCTGVVEGIINGGEPLLLGPKPDKIHLNEDQKKALYSEKDKYSKEELATRYNVSVRTVYRIFEEYGSN